MTLLIRLLLTSMVALASARNIAISSSSSEVPHPSASQKPSSLSSITPTTTGGEAPAPNPTLPSESSTSNSEPPHPSASKKQPSLSSSAPSTSGGGSIAAPYPTTPSGNSPSSTTTAKSGTYTGDITHYTPGTGSCGMTNTDSQAVCALSVAMMANGANPNTNPKCKTYITLTNPSTGSKTRAEIVDTCQGCAYEDVDLSPSLFSTVAPNGNGRVSGIQWSFDS